MKSVYIHIPFCNSICSYCDFCKFLNDEKWASIYLDKLEEEVKEYYENERIKSIYVGGGTPSCLSINNLNKLFNIIRLFRTDMECEFTFECNVNDICVELLSTLVNNKVNRLSIGVESFDKNNLSFLNRKHTKESIIEKINLAKRYFENINVDLIYALPTENIHTLKKDVSEILKLNITHISTYSLIIEEHTKLYNDGVKPIDEETDYKMYKYICHKLAKNGYIHYEVSNFAKDGYESKHNLTYWCNKEYYGFGLGAHGYLNHMRYENTRNFTKYLNGEYRLNELVESTREEMENELILGLRKLEGVRIKDFNEKFHIDVFNAFKLEEAISKKYLIVEDGCLRISEDKIYIMNEILNMIM